MSDWTIVSQRKEPTEEVIEILSGTAFRAASFYTVENVDTGERKVILANNEYDLGEKIGEGEFLDLDDD